MKELETKDSMLTERNVEDKESLITAGAEKVHGICIHGSSQRDVEYKIWEALKTQSRKRW